MNKTKITIIRERYDDLLPHSPEILFEEKIHSDKRESDTAVDDVKLLFDTVYGLLRSDNMSDSKIYEYLDEWMDENKLAKSKTICMDVGVNDDVLDEIVRQVSESLRQKSAEDKLKEKTIYG